MNDNFNKIQKRLLYGALIKSAVLGIAVGLLCAGATLLGLKLSEIYINPAYFVLIGVGSAVVVCGVCFLVLCPNDKKTARFLDKEYNLNEKIQTMVEFADRDSAMLTLQREDAGEKLAALPPLKPKLSRLWHYAVACVLGVALFATSLAIPANFAPVDGDNSVPFTFTERQKEALNQLVSDLKTAHLDEQPLESAVGALENLYTALEDAGTQSLMKSAVITTVSLIDLVLYTPNSFDDIAYAFTKYEDLKAVGESVTGAVTFYKSSAMPYVSIDQVNAADKTLESTVADNLADGLGSYREVFAVTKADGLGTVLAEAMNELGTALISVSVSKTDALRTAFENFIVTGADLTENAAGGYSDNALQDSITAAFNTLKAEATLALMPQSYSCIVDEFVRRQLVQIFGIGTDELPQLLSGVQELDVSDGDDDNEDKEAPGAPGKEEFVVGSNATIYYPDTGEVVPYGQYIAAYYSSMLEQINSGVIPEGVSEFIKQYFDTLYTGIGNEENNE